MKEYRLLYDIKSLEILIARTFVGDMSACQEKIKKFPTPTQMRIIEYIMDAENEVYQKDLEDVLDLRRATVSGVLQTMEKNSLIERVASDKDARTKKIILNSETKKAFLKYQVQMKEIEELIIKNIKERDLEIFSNVLNSMKYNISCYNSEVALKEGDK